MSAPPETSRRSPALTVALATLALLLLLALAAGLSEVDLHRAGLIAGLAIAGIKAAIVAIWFMELRRAPATVRIAACAGVLWLVLLLGGTLADALTRPPPREAQPPPTGSSNP